MFINLAAALLSAALAQPAVSPEDHALAVSEVREAAAGFVDAVIEADQQAVASARKEFLREAGEYEALARRAGSPEAAAAMAGWAIEAQEVSGVLDMRPFWEAAGGAVKAQEDVSRAH